jgi:transcriptional regulator with XRE-family HTH domain
MKFNYSKLLGRIREFGMTQAQVAVLIGITPATLSTKLNNKSCFTSDEIDAISNLLQISVEEIGGYFYAK